MLSQLVEQRHHLHCQKPIHLQSKELANACTMHKVQGLTLKKICVTFDLNKQKTFGNGQIYVALSRTKNMNGLFVSGKVKKPNIKADQDALAEYERLRKDANFLKSSDICNRIPNL